ncbi:ferredoxin family protein [Methanothermococcus sp.]|uniref:ferredoxin family protein n=1 Tax=Methanothermococcus sp. TaxID=2614238 RepID=UPI0025F9FBD8|nr:ferredoxin family protein [Methanothermococcus sp.]
MTVEIIVDREKCIGCGKCYDVCPKAPKIWKIDKNGKYYVYNALYCHNCKLCVGRCPTKAILIRKIGK